MDPEPAAMAPASVPPRAIPREPDGPLRARFGNEIERLAFFSDAVFAIALTLLAIDLRLPALPPISTSDELVRALGAMWPQLYSFSLSFFVITLFWIGHYRTFQFLRQADPAFILLNLVLLFFVVLLPFPTAVLGEHSDLVAAVAFYGVLTGATALVSTGLFFYAWRFGRLLGPEVSPPIGRFVTRRSALVPIVLLGAIPLALLNPYLTQLVWLCLAPSQFLLYRDAGRAGGAGRAQQA
ncbi:MAG: TMEM175 family protein [Candidatus Limnocylindrales bacterium]